MEAEAKTKIDLTEKEVQNRIIDCLRDLTPNFEANDPLIEMIQKLEPIIFNKIDPKVSSDDPKKKKQQQQI